MTSALGSLKDQYERKARITPGLLVILPILVPLVSVYGMRHPVLTSVFGLLCGSGAIYAIASIARGRGKQLEERLVRSWGGMPTTIALRHRDRFLDCVSKTRYHQAIHRKLGIEMPTVEEEVADPAKADDKYVGATRRLRELTRSDKTLLLKENIAYGFHRNMVAMKPVGMATSIIGLISSLIMGKVIGLYPPYLAVADFSAFGLAAGLSLLVSLSLLTAWLFYFKEEAVRRVGFAYAERLFECLSTLKVTPAKRAT